MNIVHVLLIQAGIFIAGYLGLFEILVEFIAISWLAFSLWPTLPEPDPQQQTPKTWSVARFKGLKAKLVRNALEGRTFRAASLVALFGIVAGWVVTLCWLFVRDPAFVLAREIKETALDAIIFVPFVLLLSTILKKALEEGDNVERQQILENMDEIMERDENPLGWMNKFGGLPEGAFGSSTIEERAGTAGFKQMNKIGFGNWFKLALIILATYVAGYLAQDSFTIGVFEAVRDWKI